MEKVPAVKTACGGVITAAGLSSRMGAFKPLLELNGLPMIVHTVLSMKNAGVDPICVVVGFRGDELRPVLEPLRVLIAENPDPVRTDMLASVRLGLERIERCEAFFLLPADMPLIAPHVFRDVQAAAAEANAAYAVATVKGKRAHPALIGKACYRRILEYRGKDGLRGALEGVPVTEAETGDAAMNRDADRPEDLADIRHTARQRLGLSDERCLMLWDSAGTPEHVRRHCHAVAEMAEELARGMIASGGSADVLLCRSAGLLHDMLRTEHAHAQAVGARLRGLGYERLAEVTEKHMTAEELPEELTEETIVFLADKLVRQDERVTLRERYAQALARFSADTDTGRRIRLDLAAAERYAERWQRQTGKSLYI